MMKKLPLLAALAAQLTFAASVLAEPAERDQAPAPGAKSSGAFEHDGFYLRFGMGFGSYGERFESKSTSRYGGKSGGDASGFATVTEIAIGGTVAPGLVLGGGVYTTSLVTSSFDADEDVTVPKELEPDRRNFALVGPFVDWYPNPRKGFHLQGAVGLATLNDGWEKHDDHNEPEYVALGGGLMFGVGYEWFVAEEWSLGMMARITGAVVTGEDENGVRFYHAIGTSPSLLFSATYN